MQVSDSTLLAGLTSATPAVGDRVTLAARSRSLELAAPDPAPPHSLVGSIVALANLGDDVELVISDGQTELIARVSPSRAQGLSRGGTIAVAPGAGAEAVVLTDARKSIQTSADSAL